MIEIGRDQKTIKLRSRYGSSIDSVDHRPLRNHHFHRRFNLLLLCQCLSRMEVDSRMIRSQLTCILQFTT